MYFLLLPLIHQREARVSPAEQLTKIMDHQNGSAKYVFIKAIKNTSIVLVIATLNAICLSLNKKGNMLSLWSFELDTENYTKTAEQTNLLIYKKTNLDGQM